jgi:CRP-like cAMP-binding protein
MASQGCPIDARYRGDTATPAKGSALDACAPVYDAPMEPTADHKLDLLRRVPMFAGLDSELIQAIAEIAEDRSVPAGEVLTHEGRHEGYFFVIATGRVRIERGGQALNSLAAGDFLGEISLLDGGPRTATAVAETDCELLVLTYPRFQELLDAVPQVRAAVLGEVGERLRRLDSEAVF